MRITSALYPYRSTADVTCNVHCIAKTESTTEKVPSLKGMLWKQQEYYTGHKPETSFMSNCSGLPPLALHRRG